LPKPERQTIGAGAEWPQLATYPQSPSSGPACCCDVVYLCQAFSQPTSPGRLWISLGASLLLVPSGGKRPPRTQRAKIFSQLLTKRKPRPHTKKPTLPANGAVLKPSAPGSASVRATKSAEAKYSTRAPAKSSIEWQTLYDWPLNRRAVPRPVWASSTGVRKPTLERPRPPPLQRANWLASFTTCSNTKSPTKDMTQPCTNFDSKNPRSLNSKTRPLLWATNWFQSPPFPSNCPVHLSQVPWTHFLFCLPCN
jgi:hypothetical protein